MRDAERVDEGATSDVAEVKMRDPIRAVPVFVGVDQNGDVFNSMKLRGQWWIGSFFFTSCETVCPTINAVVSDLQKKWSPSIRFVSVSTDPATDTQAELAKYAQRFGAKKDVWFLVRMPTDSMMVLAESGMGVMKPVAPAAHSTRLVLVDDKMQVRDYFDGTDSVDLARMDKVLAQVKAKQ